MRSRVLENIIKSIKSGQTSEVDFILRSFFEDILEEYNFNFVHNKVYSRKSDKAYNLDCLNTHVLAEGFNYYLKNRIPKSSKKLPEQLNDAPNSVLLSYTSKPLLVSDILKYLNCYVSGLAKPSPERCVTAREFLKFEDMMKRYTVQVSKTSRKY